MIPVASKATRLRAQLLGYSERQRGFPCARRSCHEQRAACHLLLLDHVNDQATGLPRLLLADPAGAHRQGGAIGETEPLDVCVRCNSLPL